MQWKKSTADNHHYISILSRFIVHVHQYTDKDEQEGVQENENEGGIIIVTGTMGVLFDDALPKIDNEKEFLQEAQTRFINWLAATSLEMADLAEVLVNSSIEVS